MEYKLRDYQQAACDKAVAFLKDGKSDGRNGLIVLPTGSGKSICVAAIVKYLDAPVLILQPSKEILEQNYQKLVSYGVMDIGVYAACMNRKDINRVTYAMIGSIINVKEKFLRFKYCIVDECHLVNPKEGMYKKFFDYIKCKVVGLTATPYRLSSSQEFGSILKFITRTNPRVFTDLLYNVQVKELADRGFLAPINYYRINLIDQSKLALNSTGADFTDWSVKAQYKKVNFQEEVLKIVERLLKAGRTRILVFTRFVEESEYICTYCSEKCAVVSGETPKREREQILNDFKEGKIKVVANAQCLTTGVDIPQLDTVVMARPTMSLAMWYQIVGRGIRPYPDKVTWMVDLCGTYDRFGKVEDLMLTEPKPRMYQIESNGRPLTNVYFNSGNTNNTYNF